MSHLPKLVCSVLLAAACLWAPGTRAADEVVELYLHAHITIAADGSLRSIEWGKERRIPDVVRTKLEERIRGWEFEPGTLDGAAAETATTLRLRLTAMPLVAGGDAYRIRFDNAETGPSMGMLPPPEYPREALRAGAEGQVLAEIRVDADGSRHVELTTYQGRKQYRKAFERAVEAKLARTEIRPEHVGGHPVAARFVVPISFCLGLGCDLEFLPGHDDGSSIPTSAPGAPVPKGSVARLVTDVRGVDI